MQEANDSTLLEDHVSSRVSLLPYSIGQSKWKACIILENKEIISRGLAVTYTKVIKAFLTMALKTERPDLVSYPVLLATSYVT